MLLRGREDSANPFIQKELRHASPDSSTVHPEIRGACIPSAGHLHLVSGDSSDLDGGIRYDHTDNGMVFVESPGMVPGGKRGCIQLIHSVLIREEV